MSTKTGRKKAPEPVYGRFAEVYDAIFADRFSVRMIAYLLEIMERFNISPFHVLELCCGTGTAAKLLAEHGYQVIGIDQSAAMLKVARAKGQGLPVTFFRSRLPELSFGGRKSVPQFDLATSFFDSLNYLPSERELLATFKAVRRALAPGGWFVFDMNTLSVMVTRWDNEINGDVRENIAWIWRMTFDEQKRMGRCQTTFFVRRGRHWERFDEDHYEKGYTPAQLRGLLRQAGFTVRGAYRCFSFERADRKTGRVCFVAQKRR